MGMRGDCIQATGVNSYIEKLLHLSGYINLSKSVGKSKREGEEKLLWKIPMK